VSTLNVVTGLPRGARFYRADLGDAELIVALKSGADKGMIICRGSIDHDGTRDEACKVLEGAKEAFQRRARTYGFRLMPS
jgi:hypothetical protein